MEQKKCLEQQPLKTSVHTRVDHIRSASSCPLHRPAHGISFQCKAGRPDGGLTLNPPERRAPTVSHFLQRFLQNPLNFSDFHAMLLSETEDESAQPRARAGSGGERGSDEAHPDPSDQDPVPRGPGPGAAQ